VAMSDTIRENTWVRVRLKPDCPGEPNQPHHLAEDTVRAFVTSVDRADGGDHSVFVLYKGGRLESRAPHPPGGLGIGRRFRPDELESIPEPP
jgi:hypothetical protein